MAPEAILNSITSSSAVALASSIACLKEPGPESKVFVTLKGVTKLETVKLVVVVTVPPGVVIVIGPVVAPVGTVAVIWVAEFTTTLVAVIPLNLTTVVPIKPEPEITTEVPVGPEVGVKDVIVGAGGVLVNAKLALVIPGLPTTDDSTMKFPGALFAVNVVDAASPVTPVIAIMVC